MDPTNQALILLISGFAGSGKSTLADKLHGQSGLEKCVTATSRKPRPGEIDGKDYHFKKPQVFRSMIDAGELLEHACIHGTHGEEDRYYGTPVSSVVDPIMAGKRLILNVNVDGHASLRRHHNEIVRETIWSVFLIVSKDTMVRRMRSRGESEEEIARRVASFDAELRAADQYDVRLQNPDGDPQMLADELLRRIERYMVNKQCFR